jgi:Icc-related predicted phosphoesterase
VYWLPGNHDPPDLFKTSDALISNMTSYSSNVHNKVFEIVPNLYVLGFGGSLPATFQELKTNREYEDLYGCFPHSDTKEFGREITKLSQNTHIDKSSGS